MHAEKKLEKEKKQVGYIDVKCYKEDVAVQSFIHPRISIFHFFFILPFLPPYLKVICTDNRLSVHDHF